MEKYSKWKDQATGIQPFLPLKDKRRLYATSEKVGSALKTFVLGPVLFLLRLPVVAVLILWLAILPPILSIFSRVFVRFAHALGCRLLLLAMGFHSIPSSIVNPRLRHKKFTEAPGTNIGHGDVIVANCVSYVQLLYLAFRFSPVFVVLVRDVQKPDYGIATSLFGALAEMCRDTGPDVAKAQPLAKIIETAKRRKQGPIVLFPEGTTTNGLEVLKFLPCFTPAVVASCSKLHIVAFRFDVGTGDHSPSFPVGSLFVSHFFRLLATPSHVMRVHFCDRAAVPQLKVKDGNEGADSEPSTTESESSEIATILATMFQMHIAKIGVKEKEEFLEYFYEKEFKGYKSKKQ